MKNLFDYEVYDRSGGKVGKVENTWENHQGEIGFIGISTGWLGLGRTHLIPGRGVSIDHDAQTVRVPYDEEVIKESLSFDSADELTQDQETLLYRHYGLEGSTGVHAAAASSSGTGAGNTSAAVEGERVEVPLAEERIHVEKREKALGEVRLRKVVRTETVNQPVELRREEVVVERVKDGNSRPGEEAFTEKVISIPVSEEEAVVSKSVHSAGAVQATKVAEAEEKTVSGTVRKEDVEVEREPAEADRRR